MEQLLKEIAEIKARASIAPSPAALLLLGDCYVELLQQLNSQKEDSNGEENLQP